MRRVNYKSDFDFTAGLRDCRGEAVGWPECDWDVRFWTGSRAQVYVASRRGGEYVNCFPEGDGRMHFVLDGHRLSPGVLMWELHVELPDAVYPDGVRDLYRPEGLDLELVTGAGDCGESTEVEAMLPYIKGDKGDSWSWDTATEKDREAITDAAKSAVINNLATLPDEKEFIVALEKYFLRNGITMRWFNSGHSIGIFSNLDREVARVSNVARYSDIEVLTGDLAIKVDKAEGKGLSTNDYTNADKAEVAKVADKAERSELSNVLAREPLTPENFPDITVLTRQELKMDLFIDMWNEAWGEYGCYDPGNAPDPAHPFMGNRLWMTYEEALTVYLRSYTQNITNYDAVYKGYRLPAVIPLKVPVHEIKAANAFASATGLTHISIIGPPYDKKINLSTAASMFADCNSLEVVECTTHILHAAYLENPPINIFYNCVKLKEIRFYCDKTGFDIHWSPLLSLASVRSFIPPAVVTNGATITVHPDVFAKLTDESNEEWHQVLIDAMTKNITFATV